MQYVQLNITTGPMPDYEVDALMWRLGEIGYESFETADGALRAYIPKTAYREESLTDVLRVPHEAVLLPDKDWNTEWEKNYFRPIVIADQCVVHSTFHKDVPQARYDIAINPQMAFGTGHHATTGCMMAWILEDPFAGRAVLDMGCGTAILGILAKMRGAASVTGVDVDDWCVRNSRDNCALNGVEMELLLGDASLLAGRRFDAVLANINRNILLADMGAYAATLAAGGRLYLSGFYTADLPVLAEKAASLGLAQTGVKRRDDWVAARFERR